MNDLKKLIRKAEEMATEAHLSNDALSTAHLVMAAIGPLADKNTSIDSGCDQYSADLFITIAGVRWRLQIRKSLANYL